VPPAAKAPAPTSDDMPNGDYGGYYTWPEIQAKIAGWKRDHPDLVHVGTLGKTLEGRDIPLLRLSDDATVKDGEPEVLLMAGIHPREQQPQVCLYRLIDELLAGYGKDPRLTKLLKERQVWVIPVLNVDGKAYDMAHGNGRDKGADWRKNRRPNGDGTFGVDLNRNFSVRWGGSRAYSDSWKTTTTDTKGNIYEGPAPLSEPESKALTEFIASRPKLRAFMDIHSPLRVILYPQHLIGPEYARFHRIATGMQTRQKSGAYPITKSSPDSEPAPGVRGGDSGLTYAWAYYTRGVYAFNMEIGLPQRYPPVDAIQKEYDDNFREPLLYFLEAAADLPLPKQGNARCERFTLSADPTPGAEIALTPEIGGRCDYAVLVSGSPDVVVPSEYRKVLVKTGFTVQVSPTAKPGTAIPLTLYLWDRDRGGSVARLTLTVK
jgi:carboxypeptidase T